MILYYFQQYPQDQSQAFYFLLELSVLPRYKIDLESIEYGYPNPQPMFRGDKKEKGYLYVTAPNIFVAEVKVMELYAKKYKKTRKKS